MEPTDPTAHRQPGKRRASAFALVVFSGDLAMLSQMLCTGSVCTGSLGFNNKFIGKEQPGSIGFARGLTRCFSKAECFKSARAY